MEKRDNVFGAEFSKPENLKVKPTDSEKIREQKKKKVKALKYNHKIQQQHLAANMKKDSWLKFTSKTIKKDKF